jgi:hypothetical protein
MYAMREYGHLGLLFEEFEYYEPPRKEYIITRHDR